MMIITSFSDRKPRVQSCGRLFSAVYNRFPPVFQPSLLEHNNHLRVQYRQDRDAQRDSVEIHASHRQIEQTINGVVIFFSFFSPRVN